MGCVNGARAVQSWMENHRDSSAAVAIGFLPMVQGDDAETALGSARALDNVPVSCFWDPVRTTGLIWGDKYQRRFADDLMSLFEPGSEMQARIAECVANPEHCPMWDVAYFFKSDANWSGELPDPTWWTKQFGFEWDENAGRGTGTFWRSSAPRALAP